MAEQRKTTRTPRKKTPEPVNDYGFVEVLHKGAYILQKFYALNENHLYYRRSINNGESFNSWLQIV